MSLDLNMLVPKFILECLSMKIYTESFENNFKRSLKKSDLKYKFDIKNVFHKEHKRKKSIKIGPKINA